MVLFTPYVFHQGVVNNECGMRRTIYIMFGIFLSTYALSQESNRCSNNELIVKFKKKANGNLESYSLTERFVNESLRSLNDKFEIQNIRLIGNKEKNETYILKCNTNQDIMELIEEYMETGLFEYVEPNYIGTGGGKQGLLQTTPKDAYFSNQWGLYNDGTFSLSPAINDADIDMELAWDIEKGNSSIVIAVLDAGLKLDHPDIEGKVWINSSETINGTDDDNNNYLDDINGWDFVNNDNDPTDDHGHGTNVAGIIGADANNKIGYAGVDWNARLMICKILDQNNSGFYSWWTEAIYYAVDNGANVINMSVGGSSFSNSMRDAIDYAHNNGVIVVASMMNLDNDVPYYPAGYQNTIAVGSTDPNDERSSPFFWNSNSGSSYGNHIDVVAPGNYIYGLNHQSNTNYGFYWGGTSQAAPLVTGLCALLLAQDSNRTPDDVRSIIRSTAEDQVGDPSEDTVGFDIYYGYGRINAYQALLQTINISTNVNPENSGTASGTGSYDYGETVELTATPATGYEFINWTEGGIEVSTNASYSFTFTEDRTLVANYILQTLDVPASVNPLNSGTVSGTGSYDYGETVELTATPATGYEFINWTEGGIEVSTNATYSFTVTEDRTLVANYILQTLDVSASVNPLSSGTVSGTGSYNYGETVELTVTPDSGYEFINWTEDGTEVSTNATYSFTVTKDRTLVANYNLQTHDVSASVNPPNSGTVSGTGSYDYGETVELTVTPDNGHEFINWTEDGTEVSANATYSFTVTKDRTLVAVLDRVLGFEETFEESNISIFPVPTNGILYVQDSTQNINLSVFDLNGEKVLVEINKNQIDLSSLPVGTYLLLIKGNTVEKRKIIKF